MTPEAQLIDAARRYGTTIVEIGRRTDGKVPTPAAYWNALVQSKRSAEKDMLAAAISLVLSPELDPIPEG